MKFIILFLSLTLISCEESDFLVRNKNSKSSNELNSTLDIESSHFNHPSNSQAIVDQDSSVKLKGFVGSCQESDLNLLDNGDFESTSSNKSWYLVNNQDQSSLVWDVSWNNKKPCGENVVDPRLEIQKKGSNQYVEMDSDCQGNGQFSLSYPVRKEKTKITISQPVNLIFGQVYKIKFDVKKRKESVKENLVVHFGNRRRKFHNKDLSTNWETKEFLFKADKRVVDLYGDSLIKFRVQGGKSDSFGLFLDNIKLVLVEDCFYKRTNFCTSPYSVVSYSPQGNISADRTDPAESLGPADGEPFVSSDINFTSLGFGGEIVYRFKPAIQNIDGYDLRVFEVTGGNKSFDQYQEKAAVYGSNNGKKWHYLGEVKNDNNAPELGMVELGKMKHAKYIKLVDQSSVVNGRDGFDVDALLCLCQVHRSHNRKVYYVDKKDGALYRVFANKKVRLKDIYNYSYQNDIHIALDSNNKYLYMVDNTINKLFLYDLHKKELYPVADLTLPKAVQMAVSATGKLYLGDMNTDKVYIFDFTSKTMIDLGHVMLNGKKVDLSGGDIAFDSNFMYMATQSKGGKLYKIELENGVLKVIEEMASGLGKVSGLALLDDDKFLMSVLNKDFMLEWHDGVLTQKSLKGDLTIQGSGADLASSIPRELSDF